MRAVVLKDFSAEELVPLEGESAHHLIKVVRIKRGEEVLILDGKGGKFLTEVESIEKKRLVLKVRKSAQMQRGNCIDLYLAPPKKEAFEDIVRLSTELGIHSLHLIDSQFSQLKGMNTERISKIITSAMEQSNNPFELDFVETPKSLKETLFALQDYQHTFYFSPSGDQPEISGNNSQKYALIIGPEGGFSLEEEEMLKTLKNISVIALPSPILRAPTAVSAACGFLMGKGLHFFPS